MPILHPFPPIADGVYRNIVHVYVPSHALWRRSVSVGGDRERIVRCHMVIPVCHMVVQSHSASVDYLLALFTIPSPGALNLPNHILNVLCVSSFTNSTPVNDLILLYNYPDNTLVCHSLHIFNVDYFSLALFLSLSLDPPTSVTFSIQCSAAMKWFWLVLVMATGS